MSTINSNAYVDITSTPAGGAVAPMRDFGALLISSSVMAPVGKHLRFTSADAVAAYFGDSSDEASFASRYFVYVSPPPAMKPSSISFTGWASVARAPAAYSDEGDVASITELQAVTAGTLSVTIKGDNVALTGVDLSAELSYADVAAELQTALRSASVLPQFATATVAFANGRFVITGGVAETASISIESSGTIGDLAPLLGYTGLGAAFLSGSAAQTALQAVQAAAASSDSFGTFHFLPTIGEPDALAIANWNKAQNNKYIYLQNLRSMADVTTYAALQSVGGTALIYEGQVRDHVAAIPAAVVAAIDFSRTNSIANPMFRTIAYPFTAIDTDAAKMQLDAARVNYVGVTARAGQEIQFFQNAYMCGNAATDLLQMESYVAEMWVKARLEADFLNLLLTQAIVPASLAGKNMGFQVIDGVASQALNNGCIQSGRELSVNERIAVRNITNSDLAYLQIESTGYWAGVDIVRETDPVSGLQVWVLKYILVYTAAAGVRKVEGSHNVLS